MGKEDRDWYRGEHPPTCNCADCTRRRTHYGESTKREEAQRRAKEERRRKEREEAEHRAKDEQKRKEGMKPPEDYYDVLQVSPHAVPEVIEGAYRKLAKKIHDEYMAKQITFEEMNKRLTQLNCAHDVLSDAVKRREYDEKRGSRKNGSNTSGTSAQKKQEGAKSPADIVLSDFSISPQPIELGSSVSVFVTATNNGGTAGSKTIAMVGDFIGSKPVTLNPGASTTVSFPITPTTTGTFSIAVGGFIGRFVVKAPPSKPIPVAAKWFAGLLVLGLVIGLGIHFWPTNTPATVPTPAPTSTPSSCLIYDDFNDGDFTANPTWRLNIEVGRAPAPGIAEVDNGELHIKQSGAGGSANSAVISMDLDIPIAGKQATVSFDVKSIYSTVPGGSGVVNLEYPAILVLSLQDTNGQQKMLWIGYSYRGGYSGVATTNPDVYVIGHGNVPQDTWLRGESLVLQDYWPTASRVTGIYIVGSGWDYESRFDNICLKLE